MRTVHGVQQIVFKKARQTRFRKIEEAKVGKQIFIRLRRAEIIRQTEPAQYRAEQRAENHHCKIGRQNSAGALADVNLEILAADKTVNDQKKMSPKCVITTILRERNRLY